MPSPYRHKDSGIFWLRVRVPADLVQIVGAREEKLSLRTRDPHQARAAFIEQMNKIEARWRSLRLGTTSLSHKDAVAIAGEDGQRERR
ncbi:DUF6538 domain-containing protein [Devosia sp. RR2S18]|uniref:DUF6538 domain-containing protein n=1 Tax=Devosia rhizosphaerae TaxID=3049774 RepID=UPI0032EBFE9E